jgi:hypothetical protein
MLTIWWDSGSVRRRSVALPIPIPMGGYASLPTGGSLCTRVAKHRSIKVLKKGKRTPFYADNKFISVRHHQVEQSRRVEFLKYSSNQHVHNYIVEILVDYVTVPVLIIKINYS